jgi:hypothetical protein
MQNAHFFRDDPNLVIKCEWKQKSFIDKAEKKKYGKDHCCSLDGMKKCGNYRELMQRWEKTG